MGTPATVEVTTTTLDAPLTLTQPAPKPLGLGDTLGLWGNLGISLLLPVAAAFVILPGRPMGMTLVAIVVGAVIGSVLLGLGAAAGAREGVPAMVLLRGLLGRRTSYLPTAFNLVQCVGWATFEIVIIATAASRLLHAPMWPFLLGAGGLATLMALRPLGSVRVLARYAVWLAMAGVVYLFWQVLRHPLPDFTAGTAASFWAAVDIVIALPVSWFPLAADYTRHVRNGRTAFTGTTVGYGAATIVFFSLGVLALAAYGTDVDVIDALLAVPLGALALLVLVFVEVDEAFANIYSTAVSAQNVSPKLDRRWLAVVVGAVSTLLAFTFDIAGYEPFLFLIGAVFVPLVGVFVVAYYLVPRGAWDTSESAPARPWLLLPWAAGFVAYQLTVPTYFAGTGAGWTAFWTERQADLGIPIGWSASLVSLAVAAVLTAVVCLPSIVRGRRAPVIGRLHVLTDARAGRDALGSALLALAAGAPVVQLRVKGSTDRELYDLGTRLMTACTEHGALCLVNDRVDIALAIGAHGTHLGADDLPIAAVRRVAGPAHIIGGTSREPEHAATLVAAGADYLGVGPAYATSTKDGLPTPLGPDGIAAVASAVRVPVIAIGGVTVDRVARLRAAGAYGIAVVSEVSEAADPAEATRQLLEAVRP